MTRRRSSSRILIGAMLALITLLLAACSSNSSSTGTPTASGTTGTTSTEAAGTATASPGTPQVLRMNIQGEPQSLDPQRATDSISLSVLSNIYSGLLTLDPQFNVVPAAAAEVPTVENGGISADGLTYTFKLRDGLKWSDGAPLVAQAFVDGAKHLFEPGSGNFYADFFRIIAAGGNNVAFQELQSTMNPDNPEDVAKLADLEAAVHDNLEVTAPDDQTVVYHLNRRSPVFLTLATMWPLYPVRQDIIDSAGDQWTEAGTLVSNGPFKLTSWNHNQDITLERNDNYFGAAPALDTIDMAMIPDTDLAFLAYQKGELDMTVLGPAELVQVRGDTDLQAQFQSYAQLTTLGVYFNLDTPGLGDVKVRQALTMALDRNEYANVVLEGDALPAYSWIPPGMPGYDPQAGSQYKDASIPAAQQLLSDAGFPGGAGLKIDILTSQGGNGEITAEWLKEQWSKNLGVDATITTLERATYIAERNQGHFDVTAGGWGADYPDPQDWLPLFRTGGLLNSGHFSNAQFDSLIDQADAELDNAKRLDLYRQAQIVMMDQVPFAPLNYRVRSFLVKPWVHGLVLRGDDGQPGDHNLDLVSVDAHE